MEDIVLYLQTLVIRIVHYTVNEYFMRNLVLNFLVLLLRKYFFFLTFPKIKFIKMENFTTINSLKRINIYL